ncbi:MAG: T9SS type A sorting domain-containing protein, partial [Bacteroidales bacterium]|nr:T9SS type A sorting domain-containing protein [Bacteroidales bacterium]
VRAVCSDEEVSSWSDEFVFNTIQQGIEEAGILKNVDIFPKPKEGKITFKANNLNVYKIEILNLLGEVVYYSDKLPEEFDFGNKKGIFFVNIYTEKGIQTKKIVVK